MNIPHFILIVIVVMVVVMIMIMVMPVISEIELHLEDDFIGSAHYIVVIKISICLVVFIPKEAHHRAAEIDYRVPHAFFSVFAFSLVVVVVVVVSCSVLWWWLLLFARLPLLLLAISCDSLDRWWLLLLLCLVRRLFIHGPATEGSVEPLF